MQVQVWGNESVKSCCITQSKLREEKRKKKTSIEISVRHQTTKLIGGSIWSSLLDPCCIASSISGEMYSVSPRVTWPVRREATFMASFYFDCDRQWAFSRARNFFSFLFSHFSFLFSSCLFGLWQSLTLVDMRLDTKKWFIWGRKEERESHRSTQTFERKSESHNNKAKRAQEDDEEVKGAKVRELFCHTWIKLTLLGQVARKGRSNWFTVHFLSSDWFSFSFVMKTQCISLERMQLLPLLEGSEIQKQEDSEEKGKKEQNKGESASRLC